ncbi:unnamed protein product [Durusdinium trenchii]|uniref:ATPase family AAA domain-containing protein n=1 Tax=Durusdinium trenchii TaxID=1381693 RepID=A0ABP0PZM1_9DINO
MRECASLRAEPQELQLEIEQQTSMRTQAALQRNKQDAEEKRRTISHQQEQERRTAEYKARLDSELYQSKLEDQQKQIDQQLQMQHEQFLRQEEMRKRNNMELEEETVVEEMHFAFIYAEDGAADALNAWKRFCDMLKETEKILGAIDAPLRDTGERATHRAAEVGNLQNLKWLVENGADINATTAPALQLSPAGDQTLGLTPVLVAASFGQTKALEFLKSVGADLNLARVDGATALDLALDQEHSETAAWLEQNGVARVLA